MTILEYVFPIVSVFLLAIALGLAFVIGAISAFTGWYYYDMNEAADRGAKGALITLGSFLLMWVAFIIIFAVLSAFGAEAPIA